MADEQQGTISYQLTYPVYYHSEPSVLSHRADPGEPWFPALLRWRQLELEIGAQSQASISRSHVIVLTWL